MRYTPCICNLQIDPLQTFWRFKFLQGQFLGLCLSSRIMLFGRFCCPQRSLESMDQLQSSVRGTTKLRKLYFLISVCPRRRVYNWEANKENIAVRVRKWTETVVLFLTGSIPESKVNHPSVDLDSGCVIVENGGYILSGKLVLRVTRWLMAYLMRIQVFPTAPSPTTTSLIAVGSSIINKFKVI